jgi:hypothetical protein
LTKISNNLLRRRRSRLLLNTPRRRRGVFSIFHRSRNNTAIEIAGTCTDSLTFQPAPV